MCEGCEQLKEECWAEIRDLMNYNRKVKGPMSEAMEARVEGIRNSDDPPSEETIKQIVESVRAEMIAERCAFIARSCPDTEFHGAPLHVIMGAWAGSMMKMEFAAHVAQSGGLMEMLLGGLMFPPPEEDHE